MKFIDKFLLVLLLLFTIALSALCVCTAMDIVSGETISYWVGVATNGLIQNKLIIGGAGLVLLVIALRLFIGMGNRRHEKTEKTPTSALLHAGDNGSAYITLAALDALVQRHCRTNQRIKECESRVTASENGGIGISLKLQVMPETVIPEMSGELQKSLKEYMENLSGITVNSVDIIIMPTAQPKAPKTI